MMMSDGDRENRNTLCLKNWLI